MMRDRADVSMRTVTCPECGEPVQVWADASDGVTVNFACDNPTCKSGKPPWDTPRPQYGEATGS